MKYYLLGVALLFTLWQVTDRGVGYLGSGDFVAMLLLAILLPAYILGRLVRTEWRSRQEENNGENK
jgi:hypothetical protein